MTINFKTVLSGFLLFVILGFLSCEKQRLPLEAYYFPFDKLKEGMVYEFHSVNNDSLVPEFWYFRAFDGAGGERFLTSEAYDYAFNVTQFSREELVHNGSLMIDYRLYDYDSTGKALITMPVIDDANVFPFNISEDGAFVRFKMQWQEASEPLMQTTLSRGRQFKQYTEYSVLDALIPSAEFATTDLVEFDHEEEGHREYEVHTKELFAKGIGLVYYKKTINENMVLEYTLAERYPMEELEKRLK